MWLTCNGAAWIAGRHGLGPQSATAVEAIDAGLARIVRQVAGPATIE